MDSGLGGPQIRSGRGVEENYPLRYRESNHGPPTRSLFAMMTDFHDNLYLKSK
jgi:hypothetical protein